MLSDKLGAPNSQVPVMVLVQKVMASNPEISHGQTKDGKEYPNFLSGSSILCQNGTVESGLAGYVLFLYYSSE